MINKEIDSVICTLQTYGHETLRISFASSPFRYRFKYAEMVSKYNDLYNLSRFISHITL